MRGIRNTAGIVLLSVFIAGGLFWLLSLHQPPPKPVPAPQAGPASGSRAATAGTARRPAGGENGGEPGRAAGSGATGMPSGLENQLVVRGSIKTEHGAAVPGETVELYSPSLEQRYAAVSSAQGELVFQDVRPASNYRVSVLPEGGYTNYRRRGLAIDADNTSIEIVLEVLQRGLLRGRVASPRGRPVPALRLWIRTRSKDRGIRNVLSDSDGFFQVEDFPEGPFEVTSRVMPLRITGLVFEPNVNELVTLVVDHGPYRLTGRVFDRHGRAVEGATVVLKWSHEQDGIRSTADRRTLTNASGAFAMEELAYGEHELVISGGDGSALKRDVVVGEAPADMALYLE